MPPRGRKKNASTAGETQRRKRSRSAENKSGEENIPQLTGNDIHIDWTPKAKCVEFLSAHVCPTLAENGTPPISDVKPDIHDLLVSCDECVKYWIDLYFRLDNFNDSVTIKKDYKITRHDCMTAVWNPLEVILKEEEGGEASVTEGSTTTKDKDGGEQLANDEKKRKREDPVFYRLARFMSLEIATGGADGAKKEAPALDERLLYLPSALGLPRVIQFVLKKKFWCHLRGITRFLTVFPHLMERFTDVLSEKQAERMFGDKRRKTVDLLTLLRLQCEEGDNLVYDQYTYLEYPGPYQMRRPGSMVSVEHTAPNCLRVDPIQKLGSRYDFLSVPGKEVEEDATKPSDWDKPIVDLVASSTESSDVQKEEEKHPVSRIRTSKIPYESVGEYNKMKKLLKDLSICQAVSWQYLDSDSVEDEQKAMQGLESYLEKGARGEASEATTTITTSSTMPTPLLPIFTLLATLQEKTVLASCPQLAQLASISPEFGPYLSWLSSDASIKFRHFDQILASFVMELCAYGDGVEDEEQGRTLFTKNSRIPHVRLPAEMDYEDLDFSDEDLCPFSSSALRTHCQHGPRLYRQVKSENLNRLTLGLLQQLLVVTEGRKKKAGKQKADTTVLVRPLPISETNVFDFQLLAYLLSNLEEDDDSFPNGITLKLADISTAGGDSGEEKTLECSWRCLDDDESDFDAEGRPTCFKAASEVCDPAFYILGNLRGNEVWRVDWLNVFMNVPYHHRKDLSSIHYIGLVREMYERFPRDPGAAMHILSFLRLKHYDYCCRPDGGGSGGFGFNLTDDKKQKEAAFTKDVQQIFGSSFDLAGIGQLGSFGTSKLEKLIHLVYALTSPIKNFRLSRDFTQMYELLSVFIIPRGSTTLGAFEAELHLVTEFIPSVALSGEAYEYLFALHVLQRSHEISFYSAEVNDSVKTTLSEISYAALTSWTHRQKQFRLERESSSGKPLHEPWWLPLDRPICSHPIMIALRNWFPSPSLSDPMEGNPLLSPNFAAEVEKLKKKPVFLDLTMKEALKMILSFLYPQPELLDWQSRPQGETIEEKADIQYKGRTLLEVLEIALAYSCLTGEFPFVLTSVLDTAPQYFGQVFEEGSVKPIPLDSVSTYLTHMTPLLKSNLVKSPDASDPPPLVTALMLSTYFSGIYGNSSGGSEKRYGFLHPTFKYVLPGCSDSPDLKDVLSTLRNFTEDEVEKFFSLQRLFPEIMGKSFEPPSDGMASAHKKLGSFMDLIKSWCCSPRLRRAPPSSPGLNAHTLYFLKDRFQRQRREIVCGKLRATIPVSKHHRFPKSSEDEDHSEAGELVGGGGEFVPSFVVSTSVPFLQYLGGLGLSLTIDQLKEEGLYNEAIFVANELCTNVLTEITPFGFNFVQEECGKWRPTKALKLAECLQEMLSATWIKNDDPEVTEWLPSVAALLAALASPMGEHSLAGPDQREEFCKPVVPAPPRIHAASFPSSSSGVSRGGVVPIFHSFTVKKETADSRGARSTEGVLMPCDLLPPLQYLQRRNEVALKSHADGADGLLLLPPKRTPMPREDLDDTCIRCRGRVRAVVCVPCMHLVWCKECAKIEVDRLNPAEEECVSEKEENNSSDDNDETEGDVAPVRSKITEGQEHKNNSSETSVNPEGDEVPPRKEKMTKKILPPCPCCKSKVLRLHEVFLA